jgi:hypothetical protein
VALVLLLAPDGYAAFGLLFLGVGFGVALASRGRLRLLLTRVGGPAAPAGVPG